jgi:LuxR family maltose regulon positive regulatory protein
MRITAVADARYDEEEDLARQRGFVAHLIARGAAVQAQLAQAQGDVAAAVAWADASGLSPMDDLSFSREVEYLILARVWIAQAGAWLQQALELLDRLLADAEAKARMGSVVDIMIVRALAQWAQETHSDALASLGRALTLAAPEGCIRRFVDEGPAMAAMLHASRARGVMPDYITQLLAALPKHEGEWMQAEGDPARQHPSSAVPQPLVEPLSARELEVLRLMATGKSNAEVAQALVIALSTVKTHTNSIFGKLQVTSRTQAIALARDLQLL